MPQLFTSEHAYRLLQRACHQVGEEPDGATLMRFGENAIFHLAGRSSRIVVRVTRDMNHFPSGPIHGDAHTGNLLGGHGNAVLTDFEVFAVGPREWDLVPVAVGVTRLGISPPAAGRVR